MSLAPSDLVGIDIPFVRVGAQARDELIFVLTLTLYGDTLDMLAVGECLGLRGQTISRSSNLT